MVSTLLCHHVEVELLKPPFQGTSSSELDGLISAQPRTKEDFIKLSDQIIEYIVKRHQSKPLYASFVEHHVRQLAIPLRDVEVRKAASGLTTLANEKQKEQRDKTSGKKKPKGGAKPSLGAAKPSNKYVFTAIDSIPSCLLFSGLIPVHTTRLWMISAQIQTISCSGVIICCATYSL